MTLVLLTDLSACYHREGVGYECETCSLSHHAEMDSLLHKATDTTRARGPMLEALHACAIHVSHSRWALPSSCSSTRHRVHPMLPRADQFICHNLHSCRSAIRVSADLPSVAARNACARKRRAVCHAYAPQLGLEAATHHKRAKRFRSRSASHVVVFGTDRVARHRCNIDDAGAADGHDAVGQSSGVETCRRTNNSDERRTVQGSIFAASPPLVAAPYRKTSSGRW
jgi:hypothetical protein